jgi:hypothetical protein
MGVSLSLLSSRGVVRKQRGVQTSPEHLDQISLVLRASNRGTNGYAGMTNSRNPGVGVHSVTKEPLRQGGQEMGASDARSHVFDKPWEGVC